jgi:hypothetical protein
MSRLKPAAIVTIVLGLSSRTEAALLAARKQGEGDGRRIQAE